MTPLERAARKLCEIEGRNPDEVCVGEGKAVGQTWFGWEAFTSDVRKIIEAIREPSEAIRRAMRGSVPVDGHEWQPMPVETLSDGRVIDPEADHWHALIDALLEEGE